MMLLTDEKISLMAHNEDEGDWNDLRFRDAWHEGYKAGAKAAQDEILAKLASAGLPEPELHDGITVTAKGKYKSTEDGYTSDQLRQAYAQGAAAQLAEKPFAFMRNEPICFGLLACNETDEGAVAVYTRRQA